jgi:hypothetical protein
MLKKLWHDPVWSKVIAAGIVALLGAVWLAHRQNWLPAIWNVPSLVWHRFTVTWAYLLGTTPVRRWWYGLLLFLATFFFVILIYRGKENRLRNSVWTHRSYRTDNFYGVKWQWDYNGTEITNLITLCPPCKYQMVPIEISSDQVLFRCDFCKQEYFIRESWLLLRSIVPRLIHQKLRAGTYPKQIA